MKKLVTIASDVRVSALLCCSAAVLLTACGGSSGTGTGQPTQTAALLQNGATSAPAANVAVTADAANTATTPVVTTDTAAIDAATSAPAGADPSVLAAPSATAPASAGPANGATRLLASTVSVKAAIYNLYVSPTGSDSNPGSAQRPFRTINKAAAMAKPSTIVHVAPGTYRENVKTNTSGTATARINYSSDTKWGAKVIGSGTEAMWSNNGSYVDISGFDISGSGRLGIVNYASFVNMESNHIHNLTVSGGCTGDGGAGIVNANYSSSDDDIIGNVVHDIGTPGACNGVQGIYSSNLRGRILNNVVYRASSFGIHLWHAANNVTIANNTVFANGSARMGGGIVLGVGDSPGGVILDNTKVINNIVYKNPGAGIIQYCYSGSSCLGNNNTTANNLVYGNGSAISLLKGSATGTVTADPLFVNYIATGGGDYSLRSGSPAANRGTSAGAPGYDINWAARPKGGAFDIGAYESF
jgi:hypothetical protein